MNASDYAARYVGIASFTALVWDHIITLGDEIEYIWKRKKGPRMCQHFVRYEGSMTVIGINITALMMLLRIYAMYERKKSIVIFVGVVFCVEFGVNAWLLTHGVASQRCSLTSSNHSKGPIASASAWLPLLYDTIVFVLTIKRTYRGVKNPTVGRIMRVLLKEGLLYYSVIFTITLILTLMIVFAPDGLKNLTAQMTVAMMSRITLHLKKQASKNWDSWGLSLSVDTESSVTPTSRFGGLRFTRSNGVATGGTAMNISVQEYSVMHDDHGEEIDLPMQGHTRSKPTLERHVEWHELAPVRLSIPKESHRRPM
ncbi:hypothetical protein FKP32DRAFT_1614891 [Trametes sanguinea]|nr:hypothetical protein FKP32DRAFT_1614891 [Trametes sanguinea]